MAIGARFAAVGVIASVQPQYAVADRDVADRHWLGRTGRAFPYEPQSSATELPPSTARHCPVT